MPMTPENATWFADAFSTIVNNVGQALLDKEDVIKLALTTMLSEGHLLLERVPRPDHVQQVPGAGSVFGPAGQRIVPGLERLHIRAGIGNVGEFPIFVHGSTPFGMKYPFLSG